MRYPIQVRHTSVKTLLWQVILTVKLMEIINILSMARLLSIRTGIMLICLETLQLRISRWENILWL